MRTLVTVVLVLMGFGLVAQDQQPAFARAEKLYKENKFEEALREYQVLEQNGYRGKELFYNMGNCYYRLNKLGMAIASYEKALKLDPSDEDVRSNLLLANSKTVDKINEEERGLSAWIKKLVYIFAADKWTQWGLVLWLAGFLWFIFTSLNWIKFTGAFKGMAWTALIMGFVCLVFGLMNHYFSTRHNAVVITETLVNVRVSPSEGAKKLYELHEGAKVNLHGTNEDWYEVSVDKENYGWIKKEEAESI